MKIKCQCGADLNIAGGYNRKRGERPSKEEGRILPEGQAMWGRFTCHQCDNTIIIPDQGDAKVSPL